MTSLRAPRGQNDIDEQASLWVARRRMLAVEDFDDAAFRAWIAADPRHEQTYAEMISAAGLVAEMKHMLWKPAERPSARVFSWPRAAVAGLAAAAAAAFFIFAGPAPDARYATAVAQVETFTLADGSVVTLGPASRIEARFSERARDVALMSGQAFFEVAHDAGRPFLVEAGDADVRVAGTRFDVRRGGGAVRVSVAEGVVRVGTASLISFGATPSVELRAGERAELAERVGLLGPAPTPKLSHMAPDAAGAWRQGHLAYVEAPLSELVADLNRYYAPGVRLSDDSVGEFKLTASFRADDLETFFSTLPAAAPVVVTRGPRGEVVIEPRTGP